ncbi:flocculation protein [Parasponia andersonii]|uniref:Flocculation protein n=1 Tax=Parasponia andersonii TaxID=3476 RepID=A0A2P5D6Z1_PARAD|nr:flocculation protein [Parasponia andersonii]
MADSRNGDLYGDDRNGVVDDQSDGVEFDDDSSSSTSCYSGAGSAPRRGEIGLEERLTEILVEEADGDLLLQQNNREDRVLQWLQALDMQVIGACRTDERLKPLLKMSASNGVAEDRLLAHLSQHFEPAEVGMLARCFCIPLVSIRVGKINKQGTLLCPTAQRGNLNLTVLPTSDLCLSFVGDDGHTERLFIIGSKSQCSSVTIEEIAADNSGRSFLIKVPDGQTSYFWCSEKSKLLGIELLAKMKDLLDRRPSISELTGISETRLGCFATQLRAYLVGSTAIGTSASFIGSHMYQDARHEQPDATLDGQFSSTSSKSLRSRHTGSQAVRPSSSFQGSLSPRSSSFKEGLSRNLSSLKNAGREKLRRRGDSLSPVDDLTIASAIAPDGSVNRFENGKVPESNINSSSPISSSFLESLGNLAVPQTLSSESQIPFMGTPLLSPYYCWCPPGAATLQFSAELAQLPSSSMESPLLPPLSSLLPATIPSSLLAQTPPFNLVDSPSLDFPAFLPDPLLRLPRPASQQIPTFTPLMCDPIVHIPVIDVCSSGQGYLVSAGPTISTTITPLHPNLVNPLIPETDSMVEKGARETLRLLISGSSQTNSPLMNALPAVLTKVDENPSMIVTGSRGLYSGTRDVDVIASSIAAIGLVSLSGRSDVEDDSPSGLHKEGTSGSNGPCSDVDD